MRRSVDITPHQVYFKDDLSVWFKNMDFRSKKLVELNFTACRNLIVRSDEDTKHRFQILGNLFIVYSDLYKKAILIAENACAVVDGVIPEYVKFPSMSEENYLKIEQLCNKLLDTIYDNF